MVKLKTLPIILHVGISFRVNAQQNTNTLKIALKVLNKGLKEVNLGTYQGSLLLQGMTELALAGQDKKALDQNVFLYQQFGLNKIQGKGSFISYQAGGNGAAYLSYLRTTPVLDSQVRQAAAQMFTQQKRSKENLLTANWVSDEKEQVFIDMAFAVTPFMLYAGLREQKKEYVDLAVFETLELFKILRDADTHLLHQGRGFEGRGSISEDNWSRGNGWGALALATLVRDLPADHPKRKEVEDLAKAFFVAILKYQDDEGLWHQEITDKSSFTETSGSGLILYGLGIMLEKKLIGEAYKERFVKGLTGLSAYVAADGGVSHACFSCLCPRKGTREDYINHVWIYNDPHGFGPLVLAYAQASKIGIKKISGQFEGTRAILDTVTKVNRTYVKYVPERSEDIAWENDRIAFRYYGPPVRDKVSSGIDVWAKSVPYSVVDKWYRLNARGQDYHLDRGEGCDFYHMGFLRGCGGTAILKNNQPFPSPTYDSHLIIENNVNKIVFELYFDEWDAGGAKVKEHKVVTMVNGTNFFKVSSTIYTENKDELVVGIGLTQFGHAAMIKRKEKGLLATWEAPDSTHGHLGTAVVVNPVQFAGFAESGGDQYILIRVKPNEPFTYFAGAGWEGNKQFQLEDAWKRYLNDEGSWDYLKKTYSK